MIIIINHIMTPCDEEVIFEGCVLFFPAPYPHIGWGGGCVECWNVWVVH